MHDSVSCSGVTKTHFRKPRVLKVVAILLRCGPPARGGDKIMSDKIMHSGRIMNHGSAFMFRPEFMEYGCWSAFVARWSVATCCRAPMLAADFMANWFAPTLCISQGRITLLNDWTCTLFARRHWLSILLRDSPRWPGIRHRANRSNNRSRPRMAGACPTCFTSRRITQPPATVYR